MNTQAKSIKINGTLYDLVTGKKLSSDQGKSSNLAPTTKASSTPQHSIPATGVHTRHQKAKTLMRTVVKKPTTHFKPRSADGFTTAFISKNQQLSPQAGSNNRATPLNHERLQRAQATTKHFTVDRFTTPAPEKKPAVTHVSHTPTYKAPNGAYAPQPSRHYMPSMVASATNPQLTKLIQDAIGSASSHTQKSPKRSLRSRVPAWAPLVCLAVIVASTIGILTIQNSDSVAMKMANARSSVHGTLPSYRPPNFTFKGPILYDKNHITINFHSQAANDMAYSLTQRTTHWDDSSLVSDFLVAEAHSYQAVQDKGRIIYIFDDSNATWIDKGKWFTIQNKGNLNSDQLMLIANSL